MTQRGLRVLAFLVIGLGVCVAAIGVTALLGDILETPQAYTSGKLVPVALVCIGMALCVLAALRGPHA